MNVYVTFYQSAGIIRLVITGCLTGIRNAGIIPDKRPKITGAAYPAGYRFGRFPDKNGDILNIRSDTGYPAGCGYRPNTINPGNSGFATLLFTYEGEKAILLISRQQYLWI